MKLLKLLFVMVFLFGCIKKKSIPIENPFERMPPVVSEPVETSVVFIVPDMLTIYFDTDKYDFNLMASLSLEKNVESLLRIGISEIVVEGHADERHTEEYNMVLGVNRAKAVAEHLSGKGFSVAIESYGETRPICTQSKEVCWWKNRRAVLRLIK